LAGGVGAWRQAALKAGRITKLGMFARSAAADILSSSVAGVIFRGEDFGQSLATNAVSFGVGEGVGYLASKLFRRGTKALRGEGRAARDRRAGR
jgi:hypothetical protein